MSASSVGLAPSFPALIIFPEDSVVFPLITTLSVEAASAFSKIQFSEIEAPSIVYVSFTPLRVIFHKITVFWYKIIY